jgi:hypothetical protein
VLRCLAIEEKVNDERGQQAVVTDQVRQKAVDHVRFNGYLRHDAMVLLNIVTGNAAWEKTRHGVFWLKQFPGIFWRFSSSTPSKKGEL